jgi:hypothetical protein
MVLCKTRTEKERMQMLAQILNFYMELFRFYILLKQNYFYTRGVRWGDQLPVLLGLPGTRVRKHENQKNYETPSPSIPESVPRHGGRSSARACGLSVSADSGSGTPAGSDALDTCTTLTINLKTMLKLSNRIRGNEALHSKIANGLHHCSGSRFQSQLFTD